MALECHNIYYDDLLRKKLLIERRISWRRCQKSIQRLMTDSWPQDEGVLPRILTGQMRSGYKNSLIILSWYLSQTHHQDSMECGELWS